MYSVLLLNSGSFPPLDVSSLTEFLSKTFVRATIKRPVAPLEVATSIQQSQSSSTLFLILNNKKKNQEIRQIAYELSQRHKKYLIYYVGLQNYEEKTVKTYDQIVKRIKSEFYGQKRATMVASGILSPNIWVVSGKSSNPAFGTLIKSLRNNIQQSNIHSINFQQNYDFHNISLFDKMGYCILIMNDEELYNYESSYSNVLSFIGKNRIVTIVYSKTSTIPYGFRFDQLVTDSEELTAKALWFIKERLRKQQSSIRQNSFLEATDFSKQSGYSQTEFDCSPSYKRSSIANKQNLSHLGSEQKNRRSSIQSKIRRESRYDRSSKRMSIELNDFNWVCKKKPSGCFVTLPESEYRSHGIKKTIYGSENGSMVIMKEKRGSIARRESSLLRSELQKLQNKLNKQPATMNHRRSQKQSKIQPQYQSIKVMNVENSGTKIQPRRHSSTAGYNQLNLQQLLLFQQSLPPTDSIPSTMSFGSLESTSKANQNQNKSITPQSNYFNNIFYSTFKKNSPPLQPSVGLYQLQNSSQIMSDNRNIIRSSESRSKPRLSTLKFRIPPIYIPSTQPNLKYLINITYPNQFSLIEYRNLSELQQLINNLEGSIRPTVIFGQIHADQTRKILGFNKQNYIRAILYSKEKNISKGFSGMILTGNDQTLLHQLDKIER